MSRSLLQRELIPSYFRCNIQLSKILYNPSNGLKLVYEEHHSGPTELHNFLPSVKLQERSPRFRTGTTLKTQTPAQEELKSVFKISLSAIFAKSK